MEQTTPNTTRRLERGDGPLAGVAAGLADYFSIDPVIVRLGLVATTLLGGPAVPIAYVAAWIIIPKPEAAVPAPPAPVAPAAPWATAPPPAPPNDTVVDAAAPEHAATTDDTDDDTPEDGTDDTPGDDTGDGVGAEAPVEVDSSEEVDVDDDPSDAGPVGGDPDDDRSGDEVVGAGR